MTTLAELKTQAASLLYDPENRTFDSAALGYFINGGIAEVSRIAPQTFREDVDLLPDTLAYPLRGGSGNLVANPSFEDGDDTITVATYLAVSAGDEELTGGWSPTVASTRVGYSTSINAKTGTRIGILKPAAAVPSHALYQNIPVNAGSTYFVSGWHWKGVAGGRSSQLRFHTLDASEVVVTTDAVAHTTTSADPYYVTGSIVIPDDDSVAFIQVVLYATTASLNTAGELFAFEDIRVSEEETSLVTSNSLDAIEVRRVEVWSTNYEPARKVGIISPSRGDSESGWEWWDGRLNIPYRWLAQLDTATDYLKVTGYAPYDKLTSETQVTDLSFELEQLVMDYVNMKALTRLVNERDLFTQWQTRSGNSDVSPASLMSSLAQARESWRRSKREALVVRTGH